MTTQSPARKIFLALGLVPGGCVFSRGVRRLTGLVLLLTLGLLTGDTDRASAKFNPRSNSGVSASAAKKATAARRNSFHYKPRAIDLSTAFRPANAWELMAASGWTDFEPKSLATTITVNTTAYTTAVDGFCSLREAIAAANGDAAVNECPAGFGQDTIVFNLGVSGTPTINLGGATLATITDSLIILGDTGGATRVRINGGGIDARGLQIDGPTTEIHSLVLSNFGGDGIVVNAGEVTIQNCFIGTDATGMVANPTGGGIVVNDGVSTVTIGTNNDGNNDAAEGNVISGNSSNGILITGAFTSDVTVAGNLIGLNAAGNAAIPNGSAGIAINNASSNFIGGAAAVQRNIISGNTGDGVQINGDSATLNQVLNNLIGRNAADTASIQNGGNGVQIGGAAFNNIIGLATPGSGNVIAGNGLNGVLITSSSSTRNKVSGNSIFGNTGLGIDLSDDGVTPNDVDDGDSGPNDLQNFPVITSVTGAGLVNFTFNSSPGGNYQIEFFANATFDPSGNGEGEVYLGSKPVAIPDMSNVIVSDTFNFTPIAGKPFITATATDSFGNTSEFSVYQSACNFGINPTVASFGAAAGSGSVAVTANSGCAWTAVSNAPSWLNVTFGASGSGNGTVNYSVAANGSASPRSGTLTIAGQTFTVTQIAAGAIIVGDFTPGTFPPAWSVVDGGEPAFYNNTGDPLTWTTSNPCMRVIPPPFSGTFAIVDASCTTPGVAMDEELRLPPFNATGLGSVFVEFYSQFDWDASVPNNKGDVDVSTNNGMTWTNVLRLENGDDGPPNIDGDPTPVLKSINITPYITANPANVLVRLRYYGMSPPSSLRAAVAGKVSWAVDFGVYSYALTPTSQTQSFPISGGTETITVATSSAILSPQGKWTATSNVPWITINSPIGQVTGNGTVTYTVAPNTGASREGTITVSGRTFTVMQAGCSTITLSPSSLPSATIGTAYSQTITASPSGSYSFMVTAGSLPPGLSLSSGGALTGTPTATGAYGFTVTATGSGSCTGSRAYNLTVNCPTITLAPSTLPNAQIATGYSQSITATPGGGNYTFAVTSGALPTGLTLSAAGLLSGTPTQNGTFNFRITATGFGSCSGFRDYQIVVSGCATITVVPSSLSDGVVGKSYSQNVNASPGGTYTFMVVAGNLPNGLSLDATTGKLTGTPKKAGTYTFTVRATAGACTGSRVYTIRISSASQQMIFDRDGDGKTDFAVWRGMTSEWLIVGSSNGHVQTELWGAAYEPYRDVIAPGDYDGDGQFDLAVFRRGGAQAGHWYIKRSSDGMVVDKDWGLGTDVPVPGDYDGDGKTDFAVWRGSEGRWYIARSSDGQTQTELWGAAYEPYRDVPVPADYDGDGRVDAAVFRQATGYWYIKQSSDGQVVIKHWGLGTDVPVAGDYDGDGKADIAVWRGSEGRWYIVRSSDGTDQNVHWGAGYAPYYDVPALGDYDGDGKADFAVWRKSDGTWYVKCSSDDSVLMWKHGRAGDTPVTASQR